MPILVEQHVLRLDVTVDVSGAVDRVQRLPELRRDTGGVGGAQRLRSAYDRVEIVAGHVAHDEVRLAVGNSDVMDGHHVGMLHRSGGTRFHQEALAALRIVDERRRDHLDGDVAIEIELAGTVNDSHAAPTDDRLDATLSEQRAWNQDAHLNCISDRGTACQAPRSADGGWEIPRRRGKRGRPRAGDHPTVNGRGATDGARRS